MTQNVKDRPLCVSERTAADIIYHELCRDTPVIYFPSVVYLFLSTIATIPRSMRHFLVSTLPFLDYHGLGYKSSKKKNEKDN